MSVCPVMVGRTAELDALTEALDAGGGLVLVVGEAGVGKSRLLREFAVATAERGRAVVWGRPEAVTHPGPYSLVIDLLEDVAHALGGAGDEARAMASSLGSIAEGGTEPPARQIAARMRGMLAHMGTGRAVLIEDLHYADELSQAVLAHLARSAGDDGTLLAATYRSEGSTNEGLARLLDLVTRDRIATHIELKPLTIGDQLAMLEAMWGVPPSEEEAAAITRLGEGIPFFIEELADAGASGDQSVPPSIARAVVTRLGRLSDEGRAIIRAASLMLGALDSSVLSDACAVAEERIPGALVDAVVAGLLADQEGRLVFRHVLVREAVADGIVSVARAELHGALAAAIERRYVGDLESQAPALAHHYRGSGDHERAARNYVLAGARALSAGALDEARAAFQHALDLTPSDRLELDALAGVGEVAVRTREFELAAAHLRRAADGYAALGLPSEAVRALSRLSWVKAVDEDPIALDVLDEALALVSGRDEVLTLQLLIEKGSALARQFGKPEEAEKLLVRGAESARALGEARSLAEALDGLAFVAETRGLAKADDPYGEEAARLAIQDGSRELIGRILSRRGIRLTVRGRCAEALELFEDARVQISRGFGTAYLHSLENIRAWTLWRMGSPAEAARVAAGLEATRWAREYAGVVRAWAAAESGEMETARGSVAAWWAQLGDPEHRRRAIEHPKDIPGETSEAYAILAELLVGLYGSDEITEELLTTAAAYDDLCQASNADLRLVVSLLHVRALLRTDDGDEDDPRRLLETLQPLLSDAYPLHLATALELRGVLSARAGKNEDAIRSFDRAVEIFGGAPNHSDRARCLRLSAETLSRSRGSKDEVVARLREARDIAIQAGAATQANKIESSMRALGIRPRAGRPKGPRREPGTLSAREQEVVALVATGATNAEIAQRLYLSERTVQDHIASSHRRLGVLGRAGLAAWAAKRGLV